MTVCVMLAAHLLGQAMGIATIVGAVPEVTRLVRAFI
jgi:hypothetical protein